MVEAGQAGSDVGRCRMVELLTKCAIAFNRGHEAEAGVAMMDFAKHVSTVPVSAQLLRDLAPLFDERNAAMERGDYFCVADIIENKILPLIHG